MKKRKIITFISIIVICLSPVFMYFIALIARSFVHLYQLPSIANMETWITFCGSIIGGSITMLAVYLTFLQDKENRHNEKILALRPHIIGRIDYISENDIFKKIEIENAVDDNIKWFCPIKFKLKNVSSNYCIDLKFLDFKTLVENDVNLQALGINIYPCDIFTTYNLEAYEEQVFQLNLTLTKNKSCYMFNNQNFKVERDIEFTDVQKEKKYIAKIGIDININISNKNEVILFTQGIQTTYKSF